MKNIQVGEAEKSDKQEKDCAVHVSKQRTWNKKKKGVSSSSEGRKARLYIRSVPACRPTEHCRA
jgi:hypothetical protein